MDSNTKENQSSSLKTGDWTEKEKYDFTEGYKIYGRKWSKIAAYMGTRTATQVKSHSKCLQKKRSKPEIDHRDCLSTLLFNENPKKSNALEISSLSSSKIDLVVKDREEEINQVDYMMEKNIKRTKLQQEEEEGSLASWFGQDIIYENLEHKFDDYHLIDAFV